MPHEPKKRHSRQRQGKRRFAIKLAPTQTIKCPNCQALQFPHTVCANCGYYRGQQYLNPNKNTPNEPK